MKEIFAGSFDPFTEGHYEVVKSAKEIFPEVVVAVAEDTGRRTTVDTELRCEIARQSLGGIKGVTVKSFSGFLTDFMKSENCNLMIRGIRDQGDFVYEQNLAAVYKSQAPEIGQIYFLCTHKYLHVSGTMVRELSRLGGNLDGYVVKSAQDLVKKIYR